MLPRPGAGDIEQSALCFIDVIQLRFVSGIGNALVKWQNSFVAPHHDDRAEFQSLGETHGTGHHSHRRPRAR